MTDIYLEQHPPARTQYREIRRAWILAGVTKRGPSGAIVMHTPENIIDIKPPDEGAENVARFISRRTDAAGSYHSVSDSDSTVQVGQYDWEMFGEGTGGNRWALHLACACKAADWQQLPEWWVEGTLREAAAEARRMAAWVERETGIVVPPDRITEAQYRAGAPGFVSHGELDPGRRSDPGAAFPWARFLEYYRGDTPAQVHGPLQLTAEQHRNMRRIQALLDTATGRAGLPFLDATSIVAVEDLVSLHLDLGALNVALESRIDELLADDAAVHRAIEGPLLAALERAEQLGTDLAAIRDALGPTA